MPDRVSQQRVLVFCASSQSCDPVYHALARRLGALLAEAGIGVVYGGGRLGSMGALADGALAAGGDVMGIQPHFMQELEWAHTGLTSYHVVDDMHERKRRMVEHCDAVVALPGGCGTLEELLEVITSKRLGIFCGPIVIVNQQGFFDPLLAQLERCIEQRFMHQKHREIWQVVQCAEEVLPALESAPPWSPQALEFAAT